VLAFLVSYLLKLLILGREDRSTWTLFDLWVLRIHEVFVLQMVVAGAVAWTQVRKLLPTRLVTHDSQDPAPDPRVARIHRLAGRVAVVGAVLGFVLAIGVLAGMYVRAFA
jgi:ABC-type phosphate transport system permease subunit